MASAGELGGESFEDSRPLSSTSPTLETDAARLLLTAAEREQLLVQWNATEMAYPHDRCAHELFEEQVVRTPNGVAAVFENEELTYRELNQRANAIAAKLRSAGAGPEKLVGVCAGRSLNMLAGLLGILKSGAAYVPLDPMYPKERVKLMLEDAEVHALLTEKGLAKQFDISPAKIVYLEDISAKNAEENRPSGAVPENLAYVIYTSGSTGKPKGVMIRHRNVVNFFTGMDQILGTTPGVWLAVTSICFDISVLELLWTVTRGFKVVIQSDQGGLRANAARNGASYEIPDQIRRNAVTHFQCTPSLMGMLLQEKGAREAMATVKTVLLGGEALSASLVEQLQGPERIINMYGPTETTVWSTSQVIERGKPITIGRPMANTKLYILDESKQPTRIGVAGELYIGGAGVARGYWKRSELTAERFVPNPFTSEDEERIYRTGDLARYRADGAIEYLGRLDHQVKLRGFRIELGEIEAALRQLKGVREAAVVVRELNANDKRLAAYLVADEAMEAAHVRSALSQKLPDYMVPSLVTFLAKMPLTPNGKIDRKALPEPKSESATDGQFRLELPYDMPRRPAQSIRTAVGRRQLPSGFADELRRITPEQTTLFSTLLSAYAAFVYRLSGQEEIAVGVRMCGNGAENLLPVRLRIDGASSVAKHIEMVQGGLARANGDPNHRFANTFTNIDLTFDVVEDGSELRVDCTYNADLFHAETIERWLGHFETLLVGMVADAATPISKLPLLNTAERERILIEWNQTALKFPREACIHELFEWQVERTPNAIAAVVGRQEITYRELNRRANQLADHLRSLGVGSEVLVGLCVERNFALLIGALGILKAGGAYVPLDWTYPPDRVRFMIDDTQAPVLVTQRSLLQHVPQTNARIVCLDTDWEQIAECETGNPHKAARAEDMAYIMYTSGSTGVSKGVALEHRSAVSFIYWARQVFSDEELKGVLASTSVCFDLSIFEMFVPLSWGGTVVLADNAVNIPTLPPGREITLINTVPSAIKDLLKAGTIPQSVSVVNLAGEKLATQVVQQLYAQPHIRKVYDLYGPSEATTYATYTQRLANGPAVVGRPVANTQIYIVDRHMQPCPIGVPGEIYIGGDCLARGYINRPELTAERFVPDPFSNAPGARLYKTGDLGRYLADGNIEFIGRRDHQVKLRGYRIELGEIEAVLALHPGVQECVAVVREDAPEQKQLVAYVVLPAGTKLNMTDVRRFLRERLPDYMVPTAFVTLAALPLTSNGKVNRAALPAPTAAASADGEEQTETITPIEQALIEIWREVIGVEKVGVDDDFFDLGGHSVLVAQIVGRVRQVFEVELTMRHLFGAPTISALARIVEQLLDEELQSLSVKEIQQLTAGAAKGAS
jgi:amino acid adenylation domain-containing protein